MLASAEAILNIGFSQDFDICTGTTIDPYTKSEKKCSSFVNRSVERLCDKHKFEIQNRRIERMKSGRIGVV